MDVETRNLLAKVTKAHCLTSWEDIKEITIDLKIRGNVLLSKLQSPNTRSLQIVVDTKKMHLVVQPFPRKEVRGVFSEKCLQIEKYSGEIISKRNICYGKDGKIATKLVWDSLDLLYFFGYALWNYSMTPYMFSWPGFRCQKLEDINGWQRLQVTFPLNFPTHSRTQIFYFCDQGLLRRLDYVADIFNPIAGAAHFCLDYKEISGLMFATHRVAYWRPYSRYYLPYLKGMEGWIMDISTQ